jgi:hypothetical protein
VRKCLAKCDYARINAGSPVLIVRNVNRLEVVSVILKI